MVCDLRLSHVLFSVRHHRGSSSCPHVHRSPSALHSLPPSKEGRGKLCTRRTKKLPSRCLHKSQWPRILCVGFCRSLCCHGRCVWLCLCIVFMRYIPANNENFCTDDVLWFDHLCFLSWTAGICHLVDYRSLLIVFKVFIYSKDCPSVKCAAGKLAKITLGKDL